MLMTRGWGRGAALLAALAAGCGGDSEGSGGNACTVAACGGDPTGAWQSTAVCTEMGLDMVIDDATDLPPECADAFSVVALVPNTVFTFSANQTYTETGTVRNDWSFRFDVPCVSALAGQPIGPGDVPAFCDGFESASINDPTSPFTNLTCDASPNECVCTAQQLVPVDLGGFFQVQGDTLLFDGATSARFCVAGDALEIQRESAELGVGSVSYTRAMP